MMKSVSFWASSFSSGELLRRAAVSDDGSGAYFFYAAASSLLFLILLFHIFFHCKFRFFRFASSHSPPSQHADHPVSIAESRLVSDEDLKCLIQNLEERDESAAEIWEHVIHKTNNRISYSAKRCNPQEQWDKTVVEHEQLEVDISSGIEIGRTTKKFPFLTSREYILAWRLWEGKDSFYCFTKECEHNMVPRQRKYVRASYFRSGWRIRTVPGRNACEIKMFHQEDAGLNVEMAKLAFSKGIWSYVCRMEVALRIYIATNTQRSQAPILSALTLIKKVPSELESQTGGFTATGSGEELSSHVVAKQNKLLRKPSKKQIAKGLVLVGGAICLSRGRSALSAKVALAYLLTKLNKHGTPLNQTTKNSRN